MHDPVDDEIAVIFSSRRTLDDVGDDEAGYAAAAIAMERLAEHRAIRDRGRAIWYESYSVRVARVERGYRWSR